MLAGSVGQNLGNNLMSLGHEQQRQLDAAKEEREAKEHAVDGEEGAIVSADEKKAGNDDEKDEGEEKEKGTWWFIGTVCFVTGSLSTFVAFGFAAQSLLAALESVQFLTQVVFNKTVHNEVITTRMLISTFLIVAGNTLVVLFSEHGSHLYDSGEIVELYKKTAFHIYLAFFAVGFVASEGTFRYYFQARQEGRRLWKHGMIEPLCYCTASALVGAFAVVNAKCLAMLIQVSANGDNEFAKPPLWIILVTWIIFVAYWLRRLDYGFEIFPPLFVIPVVQCFFIFFAIICGGIFFEEFMAFDTSQYIGFFCGVVAILTGVYGLAPTDIDTVAIVPVDENGNPIDQEKIDNYKKADSIDKVGSTEYSGGEVLLVNSNNNASTNSLASTDKDIVMSEAALVDNGDKSPFDATKSKRKIIKRGDQLKTINASSSTPSIEGGENVVAEGATAAVE